MIEENGAASYAPESDPFEDMRSAQPWLEAIKLYEKHFSDYQETCDNVDRFYASMEKMRGAQAATDRAYQIFWANLEVLKPAIYSRPPVPVVTSRFKDRKEMPRHAGEILERTMITSFDKQDIDLTMRHARDDLATNARAAVWIRYEADDMGQKIQYDTLDRRDFAHEWSRRWKEVGWVARRDWLTYKQMRLRFEETSGDLYQQANYSEKKEQDDERQYIEKKAPVWQIWDRRKKVVVWVSEGMDEVLDIREPFLDLETYWPCPRPAYATMERGSLLPVPDLIFYKDQVEEINELTARISALSEALRLKGFYSSGAEEISDALETAIRSTDNNAILIPIPNTAALGGQSLKDHIIWMPVQEVAQTIVACVELRKQMIDDVYQITGLSDIMRGDTAASETLGAQQLKSQYGSMRVRDKQHELVRLARDMTRIAAEIAAENFSPEELKRYSQYEEVPSQQEIEQQKQQLQQQVMQAATNPQLIAAANSSPKARQMAQKAIEQAKQKMQELGQTITFEKVVEFLRSERIRPFVLDIETDSTIQPDENAAQQGVTQFVSALSTVLAQLAPMVQGQPQSAPFAAEVLKFAVSPFRAGRQLEGAIDEFADQMEQAAGQQQDQPNPEEQAAQAEMQFKQMEAQLKQMDAQIKAQAAQADLAKTQAEIMKINSDIKMTEARTDLIESGDRDGVPNGKVN